MNNIFKRLADEIGGKLIRRALNDKRRKSPPAEVLAWEEELRRQKFIKKVNYYNYLAFFYFLYVNRIKVFLTSTLLLDYLIFLVPHYSLFAQVTEQINFQQVFLWSTYFLIFMMIWEVFAKFSKPSKRNLISAKGLLLIILVLFVFATAIQFILLAENNYPPAKLFMQTLVVIFACGPIILNIIKLNKRKERPNLHNILTISNYIFPIIILRVTHFVGTISIFLLQEYYNQYIMFSAILLIVLLQKRPLVERLAAPLKLSR